jgi:hypothetical protein
MFGSGITAGTAGGPGWEAEVDRGRIEMKNLNAAMNGRDANGYIMHFIYEQNGNTVIIWHRIR